jgi:hypothetical protein
MKQEMVTNPLYSTEKYLVNVWGEDNKNLQESLSYVGPGQAPIHFWMTFPAHGHLLADTYKRPVVLFSERASTLYLPLSHPPTSKPPICILLLSDLSHFISFTFEPSVTWPSPMLDSLWAHYATEDAKPWKELVQPNLDLGEDVLYSSIRRRSARNNKQSPVDVE